MEAAFFSGAWELKRQETQHTRMLGQFDEAKREVFEQQMKLNELQSEIDNDIARVDESYEQQSGDLLQAMQREGYAGTRAAKEYASEREAAANRFYTEMVTEGRRQVDSAKTQHLLWENDVYASEGGRLYLAREQASRLKIKSVILNSNAEGVPSPLDLDVMTRLMLGTERK